MAGEPGQDDPGRPADASAPASHGEPSAVAAGRPLLTAALATALALFVLVEANVPLLPPLAELAVFAGLGLVLCFVGTPGGGGRLGQVGDAALAVAAAVCCGYLVVESGSLGQRAAAYTPLDVAIGSIGILVVLRRPAAASAGRCRP